MTTEQGDFKANWLPMDIVDAMAPQVTDLARTYKLHGVVEDVLLTGGRLVDCVLFERMFELAYRRVEVTSDMSHTRTVNLAPNINLITNGTRLSFLTGLEFQGLPTTSDSTFRLLALIKNAGVTALNYQEAKAALVLGVNELMDDIGRPINLSMSYKSTLDNPKP